MLLQINLADLTSYQASQTGMPVQRSLAINYASDKRTFYYDYENQYLFGDAFLIAPSTSKQKAVKVFLPEGKWYYFYNGKPYKGNSESLVECPLNKPAVFIKASSIIPIQKVVQNTSEPSGDTLEIHIYKGNNDNLFTYYEDDGITYDYKNKNYYTRSINYLASNNKTVFEKPQGKFKSRYKYLRLQMHGFGNEINTITINGKTFERCNKTHNFLYNFQNAEKDIASFVIPNYYGKFIVEW